MPPSSFLRGYMGDKGQSRSVEAGTIGDLESCRRQIPFAHELRGRAGTLVSAQRQITDQTTFEHINCSSLSDGAAEEQQRGQATCIDHIIGTEYREKRRNAEYTHVYPYLRLDGQAILRMRWRRRASRLCQAQMRIFIDYHESGRVRLYPASQASPG